MKRQEDSSKRTYGRWVVVGEPRQLAHGGHLRARYLFRSLIARTDALTFYRPDHKALPQILRKPWNLLPSANVAAAEFLPRSALPLIRRMMNLRVLDLHDIPVIHAELLGLPLSAAEKRDQARLTTLNLEAFERIVVLNDSFADLVDIPADRRITISNGTDTTLVRPGPWPSQPTVGMVSVADPGKGIEGLIEAVRITRAELPDTQLRLCLSGIGRRSAAYLAALRRAIKREPWISVTSVPYANLEGFLATCTVLAIPLPPGLWDSASPVKLFDGMAAGRPTVVTPRLEMSRVVREHEAGIVARSDAVEDLASSIAGVLTDESYARRLGLNARRAAERHYDWQTLSDRLAESVLKCG